MDFPDGLPDSVKALARSSPGEDVVLHILRTYMPDVPIYSLIPEKPPPVFLLVRKDHSMGGWDGDPRFVDSFSVRIDAFTVDPDGDEKGFIVSEAARVAMHDAFITNMHIPGRGYVARVQMTSEPSRKTDWATAAGPVQYADLPTGYWRYETKYSLLVRRQTNN